MDPVRNNRIKANRSMIFGYLGVRVKIAAPLITHLIYPAIEFRVFTLTLNSPDPKLPD